MLHQPIHNHWNKSNSEIIGIRFTEKKTRFDNDRSKFEIQEIRIQKEK